MQSARKWLLGVGGVLGLLVIAAIVLPFLVDFSHFKPQIQSAVSQALHANVDFKSARLSIFPKIGVRVTGVTVDNTDATFDKTRLFAVDELLFQTELIPLFSKQFRGEILIDKPEFVLARKGLKNNLAALPRPKAGEQAPAEPTPSEPPPPPADPKAQQELMDMIKNNVVMKSVRVQNASLRIVNLNDDGKSEPVRITELNLTVENIGLERDIAILLTTMAKVSEAGAKVQGPIEVRMRTNAKVGAAGLELATFDGKVDLDKLDINAMNAFVKPSGTALNVMFKGQVTANSAAVEELVFNLHNLAVTANVDVSDLKTLATKAKVNVRNDELVKLGDLLPQHKQLLQSASIMLDASVDGPLSDYKVVKASAKLATKLTGSDFTGSIDVASLEPIRLQLGAQSTRLDLGAILKPFMPEKTAATESAPAASPAADPATDTAAAPEKEFELTEDQRKLLAGSDIKVDVSLKEILFDKIQITNFIIKAGVEGLTAKLDPFSMNAFGGTIATTGNVNLGAKPITFANQFDIKDVLADEFIGLVKPEHKELLKGKLSIGLAASGAGTTRTSISKSLNGKGQFQLRDGELKTASVGAAMQSEFDGFVGGLSVTGAAGNAFTEAEKVLANPLLDKVPGAGANKPDIGKLKAQYGSFSAVKFGGAADMEKGLKDVKGALEIKDGRINITSTRAGSSGNMGFNGSVGIDSTLGGKAVFTASEGMRASMLKQSKYASLLFDQQGNLILNMALSGLVNDPKVALDTASIRQNFERNAKAVVETEVKKVAEAYVNKLLKGQKDQVEAELRKKAAEAQAQAKAQADAAKKKAEDEAKKRAEEEAKKRGGDAAKNKLKGVFGR